MKVLLLYYQEERKDAFTIGDYINAFNKYSKHDIFVLNVYYGFPFMLDKYNFDVVVLHYSLFGTYPFSLRGKFLSYLVRLTGLKIAIFQDEQVNHGHRIDLINKIGINIVYSILRPENHWLYYENTKIDQVISCFTGYVSQDLVKKASYFSKNFDERTIDISYRARSLPFSLGRVGYEKVLIGLGFLHSKVFEELKLDVSSNEADRLYGDDWFRLLGNSKFSLGSMSGASIIDVDGSVANEVQVFLESNPQSGFELVFDKVLKKYEGNVDNKGISPRIFECIASRCCLILFIDTYDGILTEGIHYIGLQKDFSNFEDVFHKMANKPYVESLIERAYLDIIESDKYSYESFINDFDSVLLSREVSEKRSEFTLNDVFSDIEIDLFLRKMFLRVKRLKHWAFPGRKFFASIIKSIIFRFTK
jgi:hypothetical protein